MIALWPYWFFCFFVCSLLNGGKINHPIFFLFIFNMYQTPYAIICLSSVEQMNLPSPRTDWGQTVRCSGSYLSHEGQISGQVRILSIFWGRNVKIFSHIAFVFINLSDPNLTKIRLINRKEMTRFNCILFTEMKWVYKWQCLYECFQLFLSCL